MSELGLDGDTGADTGITVLKIGMPRPADEALLREFAEGLEEVFVVEEKHSLLEMQLKKALYDTSDAKRPRIIAQHDETGARILPIFPAARTRRPQPGHRKADRALPQE